MQFKAILTLLATTQLVASLAVDNTSLNPINLEASELQRRAGCAAPGAVNGQCGRYYRGTNCQDQIGAIDPGDTCYWSSDPIGSLKAVGDATYGTNCQLYYDYNCQQQVGETGNTATGGGRCYTPPDGRTGHSFRCWYRC
ncbi:hypothetical protein QBC37DRAFT_297334 [Rhypophila decipiens]|uniref:Uncharacterized protein n=1 Tax=Rhypophila decipiens TaxID=261697 RepID=A0AAN6Y0U1_9PEZI|nr:hypothetical protein QBC37DRAFT_297334 [Rhypophila decipiens]